MNNKRLNDIIEYYEKLILATNTHSQEETNRINNSVCNKNDNNMTNISTSGDDNNYEIYNPCEELINLNIPIHRIPRINQNIVFYCSRCSYTFNDKNQFKEHIINHVDGNNACYCKSCNLIFDNDAEYYEHSYGCQGDYFNNNSGDTIPTDPYGEYECPTCHQKYNNAFFVGEHFTKAHNDYNVLCKLDHIDHNGFPGFEILKIIEMIDDIIGKEDEICEICHFNYEDTIFVDDNSIKIEDRSTILMKCCGFLICRDCIMHHIIESNSIICPYCRKDHTRIDLSYIIIIEPCDTTDQDKWRAWWEDHIEIFNNK